eukprot:CAMPEP_0206127194 /NCGR_PEP_ID=MMETSP1472-20131121/25832_1 /ASSEMBLY_ACC=CAM_ASM_001108 /TAXON_ID=41880 /ORGANISM="Pycnococcus provasolii, Strain RCC251" /LENGTH=79 /DNA_ID=CAMNT_0053518277 /DNA_START=36 /DNA_END=272 /DNA_ORIENTATION=+
MAARFEASCGECALIARAASVAGVQPSSDTAPASAPRRRSIAAHEAASRQRRVPGIPIFACGTLPHLAKALGFGLSDAA